MCRESVFECLCVTVCVCVCACKNVCLCVCVCMHGTYKKVEVRGLCNPSRGSFKNFSWKGRDI